MGLAIQIVNRLKKVLRVKGITYHQLATGIGLSEAAIKRAFSENAFSLKRLEQICEFLNIDTDQLFSSDNDQSKLIRVLNEEQEELLAADEKLMCFFYLVASRIKLKSIKKNFLFNDKTIDRYLLALDRHNLIALGTDRKYRVLVEQDFYWPKGGILESLYSKKIKKDLIDSDFDKNDQMEMFSSGLLSDSSLEVIKKRAKQLEEEIRELIRLDTRYYKGKLKNVTLYCCFRPWKLPMMDKYRKP